MNLSPGNDARFQRGWDTLQKIDGKAAERVMYSMKDICPELGEFIVSFAYGDVISRPALGLKERELITVVALTAMGNAKPQLIVHIGAALNVGCKPQEIVEAILQMAVYAGFPAALNAMCAAKEVFAERGLLPACEQEETT
ncbi:MAG: carboxymuconolactone decarboxylase family protein [Alphaproteobacteria bacterium]